jgi:hypothetical protein
MPQRREIASVCLAFLFVAASVMSTAVCIAKEDGPYFIAQAPEPLPPPGSVVASEEGLPEGCERLIDPPLWELTTDIRPRDAEGQLVASEELPEDCAQYIFTDVGVPAFELACPTCRPSLCQLLGPARFCHRPLYFEDVLLERYGVRTCCQPVVSALRFYAGALALPLSMTRQCPNSCVRSHPCR